MTDNEINARVAALRDDTIEQDADGWYVVGENGHRWPPPDYCNDPAAWGGLYDWLRAHEWEVSLIARGVGTTEARVRHHHARGYFGMAEDAETGRALALAALKAHGGEVP